MNSAYKSIGLCAIAVTVLALATPIPCHSQEETSLDKIFEVWKKRQKRVRSLHFSWVQTCTYGKGSLPSKDALGIPGVNPEKPKLTPEVDTTIESKEQLWIKESLMRYTVDGPKWDMRMEKFLPRRYTSVYDGKHCRMFFGDQPNHERAVRPSGHLSRSESNQDVVDYHIWPILLTYRATDPTMGRFAAGQWQLRDDKGMVNGRACALLAKTKGHRTETCWVDVARDYSIVRYEIATSDNPTFLRLQIDSRDEGARGWVPFRWRIDRLLAATKTLDETASAEVIQFELNEPMDSSLFEFEFPPGTQVTDYTKCSVSSQLAHRLR
ncbi:MAG: hypothetical protein FJ271_24450 [Planctomycetes bacterium]|nr:hypothetical protein [Planctomycetota bacterium]